MMWKNSGALDDSHMLIICSYITFYFLYTEKRKYPNPKNKLNK
jgi:hypothetical protein